MTLIGISLRSTIGVENGLEDFHLIRKLIDPQKNRRILEPFCGTGRLLIPLAQDGHSVCGMDQSIAMLDRARSEITQLGESVRDRITLIHADVLTREWPAGFDIVILGFNCFYELASSAEQRQCVQLASHALNRVDISISTTITWKATWTRAGRSRES